MTRPAKIITKTKTKISAADMHTLVCTLTHASRLVHVAHVRAYLMLLFTCFSYHCNLFKHFFLFLFVFQSSFVHSHVTLTVCFKANFLSKDNKVLFYLNKKSDSSDGSDSNDLNYLPCDVLQTNDVGTV